MRVCTNENCEIKGPQPLENFHFGKSTGFYRSWCRSCVNEANRQWKREKNKDYEKRYQQKYRAKKKQQREAEKAQRQAKIEQRRKNNEAIAAMLLNKEKVKVVPKKDCSDCGENKPLTDFYESKHAPDGLSYYCKLCQSKRTLQSRHKNAGKLIEKRKVYHVKKPDWLPPEVR